MDSAEAYEVNAQEFLRGRDPSPIGSQVVDQWARTLRRGATVIELACGGGYPITRVLDAAGLQLWAVDSSPTLAAKFRSRFPNIPFQCAKVQESDFFHRKYEGAIAVGLLFLLSESEQAALISRVAEILVPHGRFLFMAPIQIGTWNDLNTGIECSSLGQERYVELLRNAGFRVVATFADKGENHYYDAEKIGRRDIDAAQPIIPPDLAHKAAQGR
jgi:cyclopropane fatty-acyl-phospholipid synthase-like methyltransferase